MLEQTFRLFSPADWLAFGLFPVEWTGYCYCADRAVLYRRDFRSQTLATLAR